MATYKASGYNAAVEDFRESEYPMLKDSIYLDHAGATLCSRSLMDAFAREMTSTLYGNPHSGSASSQYSTSRIEDARMNLLAFFGADPTDYDVVFVANATAGIKLVVEAMRCQPGGWAYAYHQACHTSVVGAREEALESRCLDDGDVNSWLAGTSDCFDGSNPSTLLFSYSAQSHMDGKRYPLSWSTRLRERYSNRTTQPFTLLDASSFSATSRLDLSDVDFAPDFIVLSLYKIFGFPDLGALIVRRAAEGVFDHRRYFGGGTVEMVVAGKEKWHASKSQFLHERLEDGTLPFHSIAALDLAITVHSKLFGSMDKVSAHTSYLTRRLWNGLTRLRHANGQFVCTVYTDMSVGAELLGTGPVVSFNITNSKGAWISLAEFEKLAILKNVNIRTGGLCSPGGIASALGLQPWEMRKNFSAGFRCGSENDIISGKPTGVIRASLGAMNTRADVDSFLSFIQEFYAEIALPDVQSLSLQRSTPQQIALRVKAISVFPIKSCRAYSIPKGTPWEVRPEGLAWDREWCLIHRGSGHALNQKRCPRMALMQPTLDFAQGVLRVTYHGKLAPGVPSQIDIPLSANPDLIDSQIARRRSRVCGEDISAQIYTEESINRFFSKCLGLPCALARFPPGGSGLNGRLSKAQLQSYQQPNKIRKLPGSFPGIPSPPDSDSDEQRPSKILLSNESPILMVHTSSIDALNDEIKDRGGIPISEESFRANIILERAVGVKKQPAYSEDTWSSLRIGCQDFKLMGACRRCQMVCVDQETGERREEPFVTLAKTRQFDGKVYFGIHMRHDPPPNHDQASLETQYPVISVGDAVSADARDET